MFTVWVRGISGRGNVHGKCTTPVTTGLVLDRLILPPEDTKQSRVGYVTKVGSTGESYSPASWRAL